tara:strand:+ start:179 stop:1120 length:942 start_codon:yes stop_codon:yes gene_type:complete
MIHTLYLPRLITDDELKTLKGHFIDDNYILHEINYDVDIYDEDTHKFICSFRKKRIKKSKIGFDNFKELATAARGRGASAGPIDPTSPYWKSRTLVNSKQYRTGYLTKRGKSSKMNVNNPVLSTPVGYIEELKSLGQVKPCRLTYYTTKFLNKFENGKPFIHEIDKWYKKLRPIEHSKQLKRANLKKEFKIDHTAFSTITINRNFRTALHQDSNDYGGIAALTVNEYGKYKGGLFVLPGYAIGINIRDGDILIADVHQYHANTEIWTTTTDDEYNKSLPILYKKSKQGITGQDLPYSRISYVCYLREQLIDCK